MVSDDLRPTMFNITEALQNFGNNQDSEMFMITWNPQRGDGQVEDSLMKEFSKSTTKKD